MTDPMITAANTLEVSPKPSYGPHKVSERYLDAEDCSESRKLEALMIYENPTEITVTEFLEALETLRTHLRKKYYAG